MKHKANIAVLALPLLMGSACATAGSPGFRLPVAYEFEQTVRSVVPVPAAPFIGPANMQGPFHRVAPEARADGRSLTYRIDSVDGSALVTGTEQAKHYIKEVHVTEQLKKQTIAGTAMKAAEDRISNLVRTPVRALGGLAGRVRQVRTPGQAAAFVPEQITDIGGGLVAGAGEFAVTGARIVGGTAGTRCNGMSDCLSRAGNDVWSGFNSLMGKHNAVKRLHALYGTDPDTLNKAYRRQVDRLTYAESYVSTALKLSAGNAGIDYVSPAFTYVGYYNNGEFVDQYKDAHRQRNYEKQILESWGANPELIKRFYDRRRVFTKLQRRRVFKALSILPDPGMRLRLFDDAALLNTRFEAENMLARYEYIAELASDGRVKGYLPDASVPGLEFTDGTIVFPVYADYLLEDQALNDALATTRGRLSVHVLGEVSPEFKRQAQARNISIVTLQKRARS